MNTEQKQGGFTFAAVAVAFLSAFVMGWAVRGVQAPESNALQANLFSWLQPGQVDAVQDVDLEEFWRVWHLMDQKFVGASSTEITAKMKVRGAIEGLVSSFGDPYSVYLPPSESEAFNETISGNFGGVGMEMGMRDGVVTVIAPLPDTPASKAGMRAGDVIVKIDGESTERMSVDEAVSLIRGEKGTEVALTVYREGATEFLEKKITRGDIKIPTIETELRDGVFIIRMYSFNALAEQEMNAAMQEYVKSGAEKLVLDLRGNPGGYLESAVNIAGYFLPAGTVVVRENFGEGTEEEVFRSTGHSVDAVTIDEMVVLVDGGSASAAEILAGALKEHGVATLVGDTTFGKGSVQELVPLPDDASLKVTVARWLTPEGVNFGEGGLEPDVEIKHDPEKFEADGTDVQLEKALELLRK